MNLNTERLLLTPISEEHIQAIFKSFTHAVTTYMFPSPAKDISETTAIVGSFIKQREDKTDYVYAITLPESNEFLGLAGLHNLTSECPELGIWTKVEAHGNRYGREAVGALISLAKNLGYKKLSYPVDRRNISSKKIPLYYGGTLTGKETLKTPDGRTLEEEVYEIGV